MNTKVSKLLTAICFALAGTIEFIWGIVLAVRSVIWYPIGAQFLIYFIVGGLVWIFAAVMVFIDKNKLFAVIAFGTLLLGSFIGLFLNRAVLRNIFLFLAILMLCFYVFLYFRPGLIKLPASLNRLLKRIFWFFPAAAFFLFAFIAWFVYRMSFLMILKDLAITAGLVFAGMWLASKLPDIAAEHVAAAASGIGVPASERVVSESAPLSAQNDAWDCPTCGSIGNTANFCMKCGTPRPPVEIKAEPEPEKPTLFNEDGTWNCPTCGSDHNPGNFCMKCGTRKPEPEAEAPAVVAAVAPVVNEVEDTAAEVEETVAEPDVAIPEPEEIIPEAAGDIVADTEETITETAAETITEVEDVIPETVEEAVPETIETVAEEVVSDGTIEGVTEPETIYTDLINDVIPKQDDPVPEILPAAALASVPGSWNCPSCGRTGNTGKFCGTCGTPKPETISPAPVDDGTWVCSTCGRTGNAGKFCGTCGTSRP